MSNSVKSLDASKIDDLGSQVRGKLQIQLWAARKNQNQI